MQFSIIVPVYNIENYIRECVDSVLNQNFDDYELILVDDGSTDNSGKICDSYAQMDRHVHVIHKRNGGPSAARNDGIHKANSDFIIFLDGDDYWCKNSMLSDLAEYIKLVNADVVVYGGQSLFEDHDSVLINNEDMNVLVKKETCYSSDDFIRTHLMNNTYYQWYPWLYAFNKNLFLDNLLYFPQDRKYEDPYLIWRILLRADKIGVLSKNYYIYRRNRTGATTSAHSCQSLRDFLWVLDDNIKTVNNMSMDEDIKKLLRDNFSKSYFVCCIMATLLNGKEKRQYIQELKEKKYIMNYAGSPKYVCINKIEKIIGFNSVICIFDLRRKLKEQIKKWTRR